MNELEAGEVILSGHVWDQCRRCQGSGKDPEEEVRMVVEAVDGRGYRTSETLKQPAQCAACQGMGCSLNPVYVAACRRLHKPVPLLKKAIYTAFESATHFRGLDGIDHPMSGVSGTRVL